MIDASDGGASISVDGGKTWSHAGQPADGAVLSRRPSTTDFPYHVYGAQQDNSSIAIASATTKARSAAGLVRRGRRRSGFVARRSARCRTSSMPTTRTSIGRFEQAHRCRLAMISVWPIDASGHAASDLEHRFNWTSPLVMSPHDPDTLYTAGAPVPARPTTATAGRAISPRSHAQRQAQAAGLRRPDHQGHHQRRVLRHDLRDRRIAAEARACSGSAPTTASSRSRRDDGGHWKNVTPHDMPEWSTISMIEPSRYDAGTAYVAVDRHKLDDFKPYVFKTDDGGKTWTRIDAGLPDGAFVHAVREDPVKRGPALRRHRNRRVRLLRRRRSTGRACSSTCRARPVHDLVVKDDDLVVATHGRSFWILDDITPLRQVAAAAAAADAHLYKPRDRLSALLSRPGRHTAAGGTQSAAGALIDYYLPAQPSGRDHASISSMPRARWCAISRARSRKQERAAAGMAGPGAPTDNSCRAQGMNRFVWDLRYDDPVQIPGAFYAGLPPRGPIALPGNYTVKLTVQRPEPDRAADHRVPIRASRDRSRACSRSSRCRWRSTTTRTRCIAR